MCLWDPTDLRGMVKTTLVLGASDNVRRYANRAVRKLDDLGFPVIAVGRRQGMIGDRPILTAVPSGAKVHTVTMYLNAQNQSPWERIVLELSPSRIIFNPGAENPGFAAAAEANGIEVLEACTLVMLGTGQF